MAPKHELNFLEFLQQFRRGELLAACDQRLNELTTAIAETGGDGEFTLKVKFKTNKAGQIEVVPVPTIKKPTRALDPLAPLGTIVAGGAKHAPMAAFLAQQNGGPRMAAHAGHDPREPISTIAASGSHQTPVAAFFAKYYGTPQDPQMTEPVHTITTKARFAHLQADLAAPPFGPEHESRARAVADFLRAHGAWEGGEFVTLTLDGASFVVVDIGMRMLTPRELFTAQGFPPDYVIEGVWEQHGADWQFRDFPKDVQISCCGNSVCPPLAKAIVAANCAHLSAEADIQEKQA